MKCNDSGRFWEELRLNSDAEGRGCSQQMVGIELDILVDLSGGVASKS